jgi:hypothetical protein
VDALESAAQAAANGFMTVNISDRVKRENLPRLGMLLSSAQVATIAAVLLILWLTSGEMRALPYELTGRYANRLSQTDLDQIKSVVSKERAVDRRVKKIEAVAVDKVHIHSGGRIAVDQDKYYEFDAYKRAHTWVIDPASIQISIEQRDLRTNGPAFIR